uniref:Uncharacterized protein n=1 Tax=Timema poppense TaxID=170557 RepID=A0A7R9D0Z5_TIMPO|nr:unnamed protein product [Timema poppensis]
MVMKEEMGGTDSKCASMEIPEVKSCLLSEVLNMPPMRAELTRNAAHLFWGAGQPTRLAENLRPQASSTLTVLYVGL